MPADDDDDDLLGDDPHHHSERGGPLFPENWELNLGFLQISFFMGAGWFRFGPGGWGMHILRDDHRPLYSERNGHRPYRTLGRKGSRAAHWRIAPVERLETYVSSRTSPSTINLLATAYWKHRTVGEQYLQAKNWTLAMTRFARASEVALQLLAITRDPVWQQLDGEAGHRGQKAIAHLAMSQAVARDRPVNVLKRN